MDDYSKKYQKIRICLISGPKISDKTDVKGAIITIMLPLLLLGYTMEWTVSGGGGCTNGWNGYTTGQPIATEHNDWGSYGFWYDLSLNTIAISLSTDTWDVGVVDVSETRSMFSFEKIEVSNIGNLHLNLGLEYIGDDTLGWYPGTVPGRDRFVLRARFQINPIAPVLYNPINDVVLLDPVWASDCRLGEEGYDLGLSESRNLFFQIVMPTQSTTYAENNLILVLYARANLL